MDSHPGLGVLTTRLPARALRLLDGAPDVTGLPCDTVSREEIGEYLRRYYVSTGRSSTRFHHILASDPQPDLHDHPWDYVTHLLSGSYLEHTADGITLYEAPCTLIRKAEQLHRLELPDGPVWTWFATGRFRRRWGFSTEAGWVYYRDYPGAGTVGGCELTVNTWLMPSDAVV